MNQLSTIDCVHFGPCSGCTLSQCVDSPPIWASICEAFNAYGLTPKPLRVGAICGWRTKAKLAIRGTASEPQIGLFKVGSHKVLSIPHCKVHHPAINDAAERLKCAIIASQTEPYNEEAHTGLLRYAQFFVDLETSQVQLTLVLNAPSAAPAARLLESLQPTDWHSIWLNFQPNRTNTIFGPHWQHKFGPKFLTQKLGSLLIPFHPGAFSQAHWTLFTELAHTVSAWVPPNAHLLEIYSGIGALGLSAPHRSLDLVESNPFAQLSFQAIEPPPSARYHCVGASQAAPLLDAANCIIVDPPRKGLDPQLLRNLSAWRGRLIYVSCDFRSFQRDIEQLRHYGWAVKEAEGFLLFPGTDHVEIAAMLERE